MIDKRPGLVPNNYQTKIIFVKMLKRVGKFHPDSRMFQICNLRAKFNDSLNDAVAKVDQYILTINSCNTYDHFDRLGNLSPKGKTAFWTEIDELMAQFEHNKVKLLPNPQNKPKFRSTKIRRSWWYEKREGTHRRDEGRRLPTPPPRFHTNFKKSPKNY